MKKRIGIVGLGLIGGSIEKKLYRDFPEKYEIFSVSQSQERPYKLEDLADTDVLLLCGPQSTIKKQLEEIALIISKSGQRGTIPEENRAFANTIISDVASTKSAICSHAIEFGLNNFIGGHPMAGTEKQGFENSFPELFHDCNWILTETNSKSQILEELIKDLGSKNTVIMDPETHDQAVAAISHIPLVLSLGLGILVNQVPRAKEIIGPGFKSMIRLAQGNEQLSQEIISLNKDNIKELWEAYKENMDSFLDIEGKNNLKDEIKYIKESSESLDEVFHRENTSRKV